MKSTKVAGFLNGFAESGKTLFISLGFWIGLRFTVDILEVDIFKVFAATL